MSDADEPESDDADGGCGVAKDMAIELGLSYAQVAMDMRDAWAV